MNINISEIINEKIKAMDESGIVKRTIEEVIEKTVVKAISDSIDSYSIKREIENVLSKQVSEVVADLGFTAYNTFISNKFKEIAEGFCRQDIAEKAQNMFDSLLINKRESIKLSEIFEMYRKWVCGHVDEPEKYSRQYFHVKFEKREDYSWYDVELAEEDPGSRYNRERDMISFVLHVSNDGRGWIGSTYIDGVNIKEKLRFSNFNDVELLVINLVLNKTPIIIDVEDEDDIDNSYDVDC